MKTQSTLTSICWFPHHSATPCILVSNKNALNKLTNDHVLAKCYKRLVPNLFNSTPPFWNSILLCLAFVIRPIGFSSCFSDFPGSQAFVHPSTMEFLMVPSLSSYSPISSMLGGPHLFLQPWPILKLPELVKPVPIRHLHLDISQATPIKHTKLNGLFPSSALYLFPYSLNW